jgi:hypothetical protein
VNGQVQEKEFNSYEGVVELRLEYYFIDFLAFVISGILKIDMIGN